MTLPQPYSLPNASKQTSKKLDLAEVRRALPSVGDLMRDGMKVRPDYPISTYPQTMVGASATVTRKIDLAQMIERQSQDAASSQVEDETKYFNIYQYETKHVRFFIESTHQHVSDEEILKALIEKEKLYWVRLLSSSKNHEGYFASLKERDCSESVAETRIHTTFGVIWRRQGKIGLLNRLREIAHTGCKNLPFWPALVGALLAYEQVLINNPETDPDKILEATLPGFLGKVNQELYDGGNLEASLGSIQAASHSFAELNDDGFSKFNIAALDAPGLATFLLEVSKDLWDPTIRKKLAHSHDYFATNPETWSFLSSLADFWVNLTQPGKIQINVSGIKLIYDIEKHVMFGLWRQVLEMDRWQIPAEALRYLHPRQRPVENTGSIQVIENYDAAYGNALADKLITEGTQKSAYVPVGAFRTSLPQNLPIVGLEEICIWSDGRGLWVLPLPGGSIFYWLPKTENTLSPSGLDWANPSPMNLILAALWHDLVTQGGEVVVKTANECFTPEPQSIGHKSRKRRSRSRPDTHVLRLPSQRVIHMDGVHTWGTPEEIEKIKRQAHQVRGHRRKLLAGHQRSLYALENARRFNFIMPDGYTFVKPYQTGLSDPDAPATKETPILARGLASLMLMSKDYSKRSAAS